MQTKVLALFGLTLLLLSGHVLAHAGHDHDHEHDEHEHDEEEENAGKASAVTALTPDTFDEFINGHELVMVKFFAPWCGHCKALAPEYEKAAADLAGQGIELTEVDCTVHRDLCSRFDVQGFPTVKVFHGSATAKPVDYDQERKAEAIKKFLHKQKQPVFVTLDSKAALDAAVAEKDFVVVAFLAAEDAAGKEAFVTVAGNMRNDFDFAIVASAAVAQEAGAQVPSAVIFKKADTPKEAYTGEMSASAIEKFIKMHSMPLLGAIGPENYSKYLQRGFPLVWVFVNFDKDQAVIDAATEAAKQFVGKLSFVKLDAARWEQHGKNLGLKKAPGVVVSEQETRKNFVFDQEITADNLIAWVNNYLEKKLTPNLKSEPIPETNDGPVKIVVGKTYDQIVLDSSKDVLLEFYAPWCGHCKALAPKYEALAQQFKSVPSVVIAKIDATENDTPIDIKGFPTLYFFPANAKSAPMQYDGERTTEALAKFVRENAATLKTASTEAKTVKEDL